MSFPEPRSLQPFPVEWVLNNFARHTDEASSGEANSRAFDRFHRVLTLCLPSLTLVIWWSLAQSSCSQEGNKVRSLDRSLPGQSSNLHVEQFPFQGVEDYG